MRILIKGVEEKCAMETVIIFGHGVLSAESILMTFSSLKRLNVARLGDFGSTLKKSYPPFKE